MVRREGDGARWRRRRDAVVVLADDVDGRGRAVAGGRQGGVDAAVEVLAGQEVQALPLGGDGQRRCDLAGGHFEILALVWLLLDVRQRAVC